MSRLLLLLTLFACLATSVEAGQGPQNTVVVINARSPLSVAIGHRYAQWRNIPALNLIYLDWDAAPIGTDVETYRQRILLPIAQQLETRKIAAHVTTIAYSSDFPYVIDFKADLKEDSKVDPTAKQFHQGSLTGMTYLGAVVLTKEPTYSNLGINWYYRPALADKLLLETRAFPAGAVWNPQGDTTDTQGVRYLLSTMLAYTSGRGNSLAEVENYLRRSLIADGTYPAGKVYFLKNGDIRARTRQPAFEAAITRLQALGVSAEVIEGVLPKDRADVLGAMIGTVDYRFADSTSHVRPGAICENLTSFGGIMRENGGQTALSECLRAGAAGSSGTVTEPFAIQAKFPHPMMHVHYASGCSLAEAYYQAVQGPYQLLIVGDPLCQPWATIPTVRIAGVPSSGEPVHGTLTLAPSASTVTDKTVGRYELYIDGQLHARCDAGQSMQLDTTQWADGSHEVRVVGYEQSSIATQGHWLRRLSFDNHHWKPISVGVATDGLVTSDQSVTVEASCEGAAGLMLHHQQRLVGTLHSDRGAWTIPAAKLGLGPGNFQVTAFRGQGPANTCVSEPVTLEIVAPQRRGISLAGEMQPGLQLLREGKENVALPKLGDELQKHLEANQPARIVSVFEVETDDLYQFQLDFAGKIELLVDGESLHTQHSDKPTFAYIPVRLTAGKHQFELRTTPNEMKRVHAFFGNRGTQAITETVFHHVE